MALCTSLHLLCPSILSPPKIGVKAENQWRLCSSVRAQESSSNSSSRRVWRRRKLTKKDDKLRYKIERIPFLEEQVRKIKQTGNLLTMDIETLLLSEENRFDFVNEVAAEAKEYVENNRDEYGGKKAILHVLSNRMNDAGFYRPEAYMETDPFKPGPTYLKEEQT
ncbi:PREDICTED: protein PLASTID TRANSCRIPTIONALLY ACTIVE 7 isoform X2 [Nelumbo nucifera]|uniref:Protein PLASTID TRANSCRIPTIONALLY ACTIVE 7 isoform X2 n=1 Tax=Nelumbo nucifera TaxID=4432 RepID=A0A1U8AG55_NELNU|nr:PREDICTED: protein PLASTID TRANSCRIPTIONALLY ACTIVE 7 isoform X2 [Nelumbo nucifera]